MDTYWRTNDNCVKCGRCVKACKEKSRWKCLIGGRDVRPDIWLDNIPCHTCSRIVLLILLVSANNHRLSASVAAPQKGQREYYGPGSDSFNGAYGDRTASGGDVHSMVSGAFARTVAPEPEPVNYKPQPNAAPPTPVQVPVRTNDAVDPLTFAQSAETPAGAAANMNPLYGGIVETKKPEYVSNYSSVASNVNYDPAYGGQPNGQNNG